LQAVPCIKKHTSGGSQQEDEDMVEADMDREDPFIKFIIFYKIYNFFKNFVLN
jgi:hypothetical protein